MPYPQTKTSWLSAKNCKAYCDFFALFMCTYTYLSEINVPIHGFLFGSK
jgi:hypothetical protein